MLPRDLSPASFRGVPFLCPSDTAEEGRTTIDHLFIDGNRRYAEDNSFIPGEFHLKAVLAEPNLSSKWRALRNALVKEGPGTLKHPWYGSQFVQLNGKFKVTRDDKQAGELEIEIPFLVTGPPTSPSVASGIAAHVSSLASQGVSQAFSDFSASTFAGSSATAAAIANAVAGLGDALDIAFGGASPEPDRMIRSAGTLAADAATLAGVARRAFRAPFATKAISDSALVSGFAALAAFGQSLIADATAIVPTTLDLVSRAQALQLLGMTVEAAAFAGLAEAMAGRKYGTAEDVERDESLLADAYAAVQTSEMSPALARLLADVHVAASEVLRDSAVRLPRVTTIRQTNIPASVLAYLLYDGDANEQQLIDLNLDQTPILMTGDIEVLING